MDTWAVSIPLGSLAAAGRLRHLAGLEICTANDQVWIRGRGASEELDLTLRSLPGALRYEVLDDGRLILAGRRVPDRFLPDGEWVPLEKWLEVTLPGATLAGRVSTRVPLVLVRWESTAMLPESLPNLLLSDMAAWRQYASAAPQVRLDRWHFAAASDGRVLVRGTPPPPLAGRAYHEQAGIAVPIGYVFSPAVDHAVVRQLLQLAPHELALFHADSSWERLSAEQFVRASRSAAREIQAGSSVGNALRGVP